MSKLTPLHINLIGAGAVLVLALILYFALIKPKTEQIQASKASYDAAVNAGGTEEKVALHKKDLAKSKEDTKVILKAWAINQDRYMPRMEFFADQKSSNLLNMYEFGGMYSDGKLYGFRDIPTVWGVKVKNWYDAHYKEGVSRDFGQEFPIEAFSTNPNDISKLSAITFPEGKPWHVSVIAKTFDDAMLHLRRFNSMRGFGMPVVDGVELAGQSPNLNMTYDFALYIIPPAAPPAPDPIIGAGGGAAPAATSGFGGPKGR